MPLGTAPRRVGPGVWVTRTGRRLTPEGAKYWEQHYRAGQTDGSGHVNHPKLHQDYLRREIANPNPNVHHDVDVLGFKGASELSRARERYRSHVTALNTQKLEPLNRKRDVKKDEKVARQVQEREIDRALYYATQGAYRHASSALTTPATIIGGTLGAFSPATWGESIYKDIQHGNAGMATLDIATLLPILRGPKAIAAGLKGARAAEEGVRAAEFAKTAKEAYRTSTPIRTALRGARGARAFRVGNTHVVIPAADSRTGRAMEAITDRALRPILSKAGLMKSEAERGAYEAKITRENIGRITGAPTSNLARHTRKLFGGLRPAQEYAMRIVLEGVAPETRAAEHMKLSQFWEGAGANDLAVYHKIHVEWNRAASKYITLEQGLPRLSENAPRKLKSAIEAFLKVGAQREDLLRALEKITDDRIATRIHAPGRFFAGARAKAYEDQVNELLESNPGRKQFHAAIDAMTDATPAQKQGIKAILDARERQLLRAQLIGKTEKLGGSAFTGTEVRTLEVDQLPEGLRGLYQSTPPAPKMPPALKPEAIQRIAVEARAHKLPPALQADLEQRIAQVYEYVKEGAPYRDWYDRAGRVLNDAAKRLGLSAEQMAKITAVTSPQAMPTENLRRAITIIRKERGDLPKGAKPSTGTGQTTEKARGILAGKEFEYNPKSPKTHNYYRNLLESMDPAGFKKSGLEAGVTVDLHATNALFPELEGDPKQFYEGIAAVYKGIARELGWSAKEVQAAAWVPVKARHEVRGIEAKGKTAQGHEAYMGTGADAYERGQAKYRDVLYQEDTPNDLQKAKAVVDQAREPDGGFTLNPDLTPDNRTSGYGVSLKGFERKIPAQELTPEHLVAYRNSVGPFLEDPGARIGGWHNPDDGQVYLDVSNVVDDPREALLMARKEEQLAVFDFSTFESLTPDQLEQKIALEGIQTLKPHQAFQDAAAEELQAYSGLARDVARTLPEDEWPAWVRNQINDQSKLDLPTITDTDKWLEAQRQRKNIRRSLDEPTQWGEPLPQEGGPTGMKVKGAVEFDQEGQAVVSLVKYASGLGSADLSTVAHEWMHVVRRRMSLQEQKRLASWAGAKPIREQVSRDAELPASVAGQRLGKIIDYEWSREAEEKVARGFEQLLRTGAGPAGLKKAFKSLSPVFDDLYERGELPDLDPKVAQGLYRLFESKPLHGKSLVGAEDIKVGVAYVPTFAGVPVRVNPAQRAWAGLMRRSQGIFSGAGRRRAVSGRDPEDQALLHSYYGGSILTGFFTPDVIGPMVEKAMVAQKIATYRHTHDFFVKAGTAMPKNADDIPIKVDPLTGDDAKSQNEQIRRVWDFMESTQLDKKELTKALEGINYDMTEELRQGLFNIDRVGSTLPLQGRNAQDVAREIMQSQKPIEGVVWVDRHVLMSSGVLDVPQAARLFARAMTRQQGKIARGTGLTVDAINDFQKALILYFNPAYIPVNLVGNLGMNLMHQGVFMPVNLWKSVLMHREFDKATRIAVDEMMGSGLTHSLGARTTPGQFLHQTMGTWINAAVDLMPRRAAFLHEARIAGYKKPEDLKALIRAGQSRDPQALQTLDGIIRRAKDGIVDYDRLNPLEKNVIARFIFFYPWLRGATRYSARFVAEHPVQAMALALAADHAKETSDEMLGERPFYAELATPLSTKTLGLKVPGTGIDVGLDQAVGEHTWTDRGMPMVVNPRQLFTQTTPLELGEAAYGYLSGDANFAEAGADVVSHLTPFPYAVGVSFFGKDPFKQQDVPQNLGTLLSQLGPGQTPWMNSFHNLNMTKDERARKNAKALNPRTREQDWWKTFGSGLAPAPYNPEIGAKRALENKPALERNIEKLRAGAQQLGLGDPPPEAFEDLRWISKLDKELKKNDSYGRRFKVAAQLVKERYGVDYTGYPVRTEGEAKDAYEQLRAMLNKTYSQWSAAIRRYQGQQRAAQPAGP